MYMYVIVKVTIFASILVTLVTCQAPGDEMPSCLSAGPSNIRVLMDSNNYATLLGPGGVWTAADLDGSGTTWTPGSGGNCQRTMYMCEKLPTSNNWIFTQYISKSVSAVANMTIYINVTLRFSTCTPACPKSLGVYTFITNTPQTTINVSNFSFVSNFIASTTNILEPVLSINLKPNDTGFYVAFRDGGSCINLNRVKIYYYQCPGQQMGLVLFPVTTAPTKSNSPLTVAASCVIGGVNTASLNLQCNSSGAWSGSPSCICSVADGYMPSGPSSCAGCGAGYWLDVPTVSCQPCPPNSSSTSVVALECPCIAGYYRSSNEGPSIGCTAPPSSPNNLTVAAVTNTSITLQWGKPDDVGRDDYYFVLEYRSIGSIQFIAVPNVTDTSDTIIYILSGLTPYTTYNINVIARNGVSDQDISNEYKRTSNVNTMTSQGAPDMTSPPCSPCPLQLSCSQCSTLCAHISSSSVGLSSSQSPLPSLCLVSGSFGLCTTLLTSQAAQSMDESGIQQNVIATYLGVVIGVLFPIATTIIVGVLIVAYRVRRDYKKKKLELANAATCRETDNTVAQDTPLETFESK